MVTGSTASNFNLTYVGSFRGPQGDPGINAYITGITAVVNDTTGTPSVNITTAGTSSNISFKLLFDGLKGKPGEKGANGTNGSTWYNGATEPSTSTGVNGDWYLNTLTWDIFHKESNSWIKKGNIKGATGSFDDSKLSNYALKSDIPDISNKVDKINGKGLSTNDFTNDLKNKLDSIAEGAEVNVQSDWNETATDSDAYIKNKPKLFSGNYNDLSNRPTLANVATSGNYNDLSNKPDISGIQSKLDGIAAGAEVNVQSDWNETATDSDAYIKNKPKLATVATSGNYNDLSNKPDISGKVDKVNGKGLSTNDFTNDLKTKLDGIAAGAEVNVQSDWNATSGDALILNKPSLAKVATSGSYNDLSNTPDIPDISGKVDKVNGKGLSTNDFTNDLKNKLDGIAAGAEVNVQSDWSETATTSDAYIKNKPKLATVATSGDYNDLSNTPTIPSVDGFIKNISLTTSGEKLYIVGSTSQTGTTTSLNTSTTDVYMQGGEVYAASDERLKDFGDNVEVDFNELSEIPKVYYSWKSDEEKRQMIGTSAQKLREIYPELVSENEDGKMAVSYEKLSIIALAAIDKLHKENEELKDRLKRIEEILGL